MTSLTPIVEDVDPRGWLGVGAASAAELSVFLHEATHHWTFTSPVVFAITGLMLRARAALGRLDKNDDAQATSIAWDLARANTAIELLRPLSEGMALFAEFDATSRHRSRAMSAILAALPPYFATRNDWGVLSWSLPETLAFADLVSRTLLRSRIAASTIDKKASLLLKPLSASAGGYLPGYLTLKSLWRTLAARDSRLASETDLFLMYLRSYVYDDWGMVAELLRPDAKSQSGEPGERLVSYVSDRLDGVSHVTAADIEDYENHLLGATGGNQQCPGLRVRPEQSSLGLALMDSLVQELRSTTSSDTLDATMRRWHVRLLSRRHYMNLVSTKVNFDDKSATARIVLWNKEPVLTLSPEDILADDDASGAEAQLDVVFALRVDRIDRAVVIHRRGRVAACVPVSLSEHATDVRRDVVGAFLDRSKTVALEEQIRVAVDLFIEGTTAGTIVREARQYLSGILDEFYGDLALRFAASYESIDWCLAAMRQNGFRSVLSKSSLVVGLALLGLATSINPSTEFVAAVFTEQGLDLERTLAELDEVHSSVGYPPRVLRTSTQLLSTI